MSPNPLRLAHGTELPRVILRDGVNTGVSVHFAKVLLMQTDMLICVICRLLVCVSETESNVPNVTVVLKGTFDHSIEINSADCASLRMALNVCGCVCV